MCVFYGEYHCCHSDHQDNVFGEIMMMMIIGQIMEFMMRMKTMMMMMKEVKAASLRAEQRERDREHNSVLEGGLGYQRWHNNNDVVDDNHKDEVTLHDDDDDDHNDD